MTNTIFTRLGAIAAIGALAFGLSACDDLSGVDFEFPETTPIEEPSETPSVETDQPEDPALETEGVERPASDVDVYDRDAFGGWADPLDVGCDGRNVILQRDLDEVILDTDGCTVLTGVLNDDPYTGLTVEFERGQYSSRLVPIDHIYPVSMVLPTAEAEGWNSHEMAVFYNDPDNLVATTELSDPYCVETCGGGINGWKSDKMPAEILEALDEGLVIGDEDLSPDFDQCFYSTQMLIVTERYELPIPDADATALSQMQETC